MAVFSAEERARIEASISKLEALTAAEVVVVTSRASDRYLDVRLAASVALGLAAAAIAHFVWPALSVAPLLALELAAGVVGWLLTSLRPVLRLLISVERRQLAVEQACEREFLEHAVFETRDRTGVLILLSELEQRVAILGDKGIHALLAKQGWSELVNHVVQSIHAGRACEGMCEVIDRLGETLSHLAPPRGDDMNELSNHVRER